MALCKKDKNKILIQTEFSYEPKFSLAEHLW